MLVVGRLALAFVLIVATALLGRSLYSLRAIGAGFNANGVLTLTPVLSAGGTCADAGRPRPCFRQMVDAVQAVPNVVAAGMISNVPLSHIEPVRLRLDRPSPAHGGTG